MKIIYKICLLLFLNFSLISQNESSQWYFGKYAALSFLTSPPTALNNSAMVMIEGSASIADGAGNLLFYTDGSTVWNQSHQIMPNGTGLLGNASSTQSALIIKQPGNQNIYFIITTYTQLRYSVVDMSLAGGTGSVTAKNVLLSLSTVEKLAGVRHCNGTDIWFVAHSSVNSNFMSFLVTSSGISASPVLSSVGPVYSSSNNYGQLKFSQQGNKLGLALPYPTFATSHFAVCDFDNTTGAVTNYNNVANFAWDLPYGCEFSSDGTKFYGTSTGLGAGLGKIYQWDLCAVTPSNIAASCYTLSSPTVSFHPMGLQLAPDGKIYAVTNVQLQTLSSINNPNASGLACNFVPNMLSIGTGSTFYTLPSFVSSSIKAPSLSFTTDLGCSNTATFNTQNCSGSNPVTSANWNFGDPSSGINNTSTLSNPLHTYPAPGPYTVQLILNYTACVPDTFKQVITIAPSTISVQQASLLCNGFATASIHVQPPSGILTYSWSPGPFAGAVANSLVPGTYTVSVGQLGNSCVKVQTVIINPANSITASVSFSQTCANASSTLQMNGGSGNYTFSWSPGSQTTSAVSGLATGMYTVTGTDILNQCVINKTIQVVPPTNPTLSSSPNLTVCAGSLVTLTVSGTLSYSWSTGSTSTVVSVSPNVSTTYTVRGTNQIGCSSTVSITVTASNCVPVLEHAAQEYISVFPTISKGELLVTSQEHVNIKIVDMSGKLVFNGTLEKGTNRLGLHYLNAGCYIIEAEGKYNTHRKRFFIED